MNVSIPHPDSSVAWLLLFHECVMLQVYREPSLQNTVHAGTWQAFELLDPQEYVFIEL